MNYIDNLCDPPPFRVRTFGCVKDSARHFSPGTKDGDTMLIINIDGLGHYRNSSGQITVEPSMLGLIPPEDCGVLYSDEETPYFHYYCRFNGGYANHLAAQIITERGGRFFSFPSVERIANCLVQLPFIVRKELPECMGEYELAIARILVTLAGNQPERDSPGVTAHALRQYIEVNLDRLINLDDMASHFGMTKPALCRVAKTLLGATIVQTSTAIRIAYACELLKTHTMNVAEIARRVGFDDQFYFSRVFKSLVGISPKQWQRSSSRPPGDGLLG